MISTGESGRILFSYCGDLVPLWKDVKSTPPTGSEGKVNDAAGDA
jgi:hypothetical protein